VLALVVTAALLGAFGLAALMEIGKLAGLTKGGIPSDNTRRYLNLFKVIHLVHGAEEPSRIIVTGPRIRSLTCQICMGAIKEGSNFTYCKCGRPFHLTCLSRTGSCPYCKESYEDIIAHSEGGSEPFESHSCPLCGRKLPHESTMCECGAIVVEEGENFQCPSCGLIMTELNAECPRCGEIFETFEIVECPVCGRQISANTDVCECGALIGGRCPECGKKLSSEDLVCDRCGTEFENV